MFYGFVKWTNEMAKIIRGSKIRLLLPDPEVYSNINEIY